MTSLFDICSITVKPLLLKSDLLDHLYTISCSGMKRGLFLFPPPSNRVSWSMRSLIVCAGAIALHQRAAWAAVQSVVCSSQVLNNSCACCCSPSLCSRMWLFVALLHSLCYLWIRTSFYWVCILVRVYVCGQTDNFLHTFAGQPLCYPVRSPLPALRQDVAQHLAQQKGGIITLLLQHFM